MRTPSDQIVDNSELGNSNTYNKFFETGTGTFTAVTGGFNGGETALTGVAKATWMFDNLDSADYPYYDVYVTWNPQLDGGTASYSVKDDDTPRSAIAVSGQPTIDAPDDSQAPVDDAGDGVYWRDLGQFVPGTGGGSGSSGGGTGGDGTTTIGQHLVYDSSGQVTTPTDSSTWPTFTYDGEWEDPTTKLDKMGARWYDARDAVFASYDPSGLTPDTNPSRFCGNGPTNGTDPSGLAPTQFEKNTIYKGPGDKLYLYDFEHDTFPQVVGFPGGVRFGGGSDFTGDRSQLAPSGAVLYTTEDLVRQLRGSDVGETLWQEAKKGNGGEDPKVVFGEESFGGSTTAGEITLDPSNISGGRVGALDTLAFELGNVKQRAAFAELDADASAGHVSREYYIREKARIEYNNWAPQKLVHDQVYPNEEFTRAWHADYQSFDEYFRVAPQNYKDCYGNQWDDRYRSAYASANPPSWWDNLRSSSMWNFLLYFGQ